MTCHRLFRAFLRSSKRRVLFLAMTLLGASSILQTPLAVGQSNPKPVIGSGGGQFHSGAGNICYSQFDCNNEYGLFCVIPLNKTMLFSPMLANYGVCAYM
jgi:hypothetical protein